MVVLSFTKFATEKGTFFAVEKVAFDEVRRIADAFEQSITCDCQKSKKASSDEEESSQEDDEGQSSSIEEIRDDEIYTERTSRQTRGNRYHIVMANIFNYWITLFTANHLEVKS